MTMKEILVGAAQLVGVVSLLFSACEQKTEKSTQGMASEGGPENSPTPHSAGENPER
jgi:hypothetical protein